MANRFRPLPGSPCRTVTHTVIRDTGASANSSPTVANPLIDKTATSGVAFTYQFAANTFADADLGDTLTYTATKSDDSPLPAWLTFTAGTRTFSGTPASSDAGTLSVKVTASDGLATVSDIFDIVVTAVGSLTLRPRRQFRSRALIRM